MAVTDASQQPREQDPLPLRPPRRRLLLPRLRQHPPRPHRLIATHPVAVHVPDACGAAPSRRAVKWASDGRQQATTMTESPLGRSLARRCWRNSPLGQEPEPEPCRGDRIGVAGCHQVDGAARPVAAARHGAGDSAKQQLVHAGPNKCVVHSRGAAGVGGGGRRVRRWGEGGQSDLLRGGRGPHQPDVLRHAQFLDRDTGCLFGQAVAASCNAPPLEGDGAITEVALSLAFVSMRE